MRAYIVDADGYFVNVIVWDGVAIVALPSGCRIIPGDGVMPPVRE